MRCVFPDWKQGSKCILCGYQLPREFPNGLFRKCDSDKDKPPANGLGDHTERMLAAIGITQEWWGEVKKNFGLSPACNCDSRKAWLNKVGDWWRSGP